MRELIKLRTDRRETLVDITPQVRELVRHSTAACATGWWPSIPKARPRLL